MLPNIEQVLLNVLLGKPLENVFFPGGGQMHKGWIEAKEGMVWARKGFFSCSWKYQCLVGFDRFQTVF